MMATLQTLCCNSIILLLLYEMCVSRKGIDIPPWEVTGYFEKVTMLK